MKISNTKCHQQSLEQIFYIDCEKLEFLNLQDKKLVLITSAYHMKRSKACFDKVGLKTTTFPTDYYSTDITTWESFIPSIKAMSFSGTLLHELFGMAIYKLFGYI